MADARPKAVADLFTPPRLVLIVLVLLAAGGLLALLPPGERAADPPGERANVVVIIVDDQDAWSLRVMPKTARKLAGQGITFERFFATFPLCCPSRATMLTGQYAHNHGIWSNDSDGLDFDDPADLPIALQAAGYRTAWVGKYLNGYGRGPETKREIPAGWNRWTASVAASETSIWASRWGSAFHRMFGYQLNDNGRIRRYEGRSSDYQTDVLARLAAREAASCSSVRSANGAAGSQRTFTTARATTTPTPSTDWSRSAIAAIRSSPEPSS